MELDSKEDKLNMYSLKKVKESDNYPFNEKVSILSDFFKKNEINLNDVLQNYQSKLKEITLKSKTFENKYNYYKKYSFKLQNENVQLKENKFIEKNILSKDFKYDIHTKTFNKLQEIVSCQNLLKNLNELEKYVKIREEKISYLEKQNSSYKKDLEKSKQKYNDLFEENLKIWNNLEENCVLNKQLEEEMKLALSHNEKQKKKIEKYEKEYAQENSQKSETIQNLTEDITFLKNNLFEKENSIKIINLQLKEQVHTSKKLSELLKLKLNEYETLKGQFETLQNKNKISEVEIAEHEKIKKSLTQEITDKLKILNQYEIIINRLNNKQKKKQANIYGDDKEEEFDQEDYMLLKIENEKLNVK